MKKSFEELKRKISEMKLVFVIIAILLLSSISTTVFFYYKLQRATNPDQAAKEELDLAVKKVGALMVLPDDETPTLATVSDPEKLKDQQFFARAEKGDKVLLYSKAKKAILYSSSKNKIIEVAPFNTNGAPSTN